jgi:ribosomal protein S18 acetylase RimI-like enzyme
MLEIVNAQSCEFLEEARVLFAEYGEATDIHLSDQKFDEEIAGLPQPYIQPAGCLLLALYEGQAVGCVALRDFGGGVCEMKRLYVKPEFRSLKIGKALAEAIVEECRRLGYRLMRLDTLASMVEAQRLYTSLGFKRIDPYFEKVGEETVFMELSL